MTWLVTGSGGFLGGSFAARAAARGARVIGVNREPVSPAGSAREITMELEVDALVELLDSGAVERVFHAAGSASVAASVREPRADFEASVGLWSLVLEAARRARRPPLVVFPSSAAVYGSVEGVITEETPTSPVSPYGFHKLACELLAREYQACFGVRSHVIRVFSTFGPRQRRLLLWELFEQACERGEVVLQGTGQEERDYLHVDDLCELILDVTRGASCPAVLNVASGRSVTTRALADMVREALSIDAPLRCLGQARAGDPAIWRVATHALTQHTTRAVRPLEVGVADCIATWRAQSR